MRWLVGWWVGRWVGGLPFFSKVSEIQKPKTEKGEGMPFAREGFLARG